VSSREYIHESDAQRKELFKENQQLRTELAAKEKETQELREALLDVSDHALMMEENPPNERFCADCIGRFKNMQTVAAKALKRKDGRKK